MGYSRAELIHAINELEFPLHLADSLEIDKKNFEAFLLHLDDHHGHIVPVRSKQDILFRILLQREQKERLLSAAIAKQPKGYQLWCYLAETYFSFPSGLSIRPSYKGFTVSQLNALLEKNAIEVVSRTLTAHLYPPDVHYYCAVPAIRAMIKAGKWSEVSDYIDILMAPDRFAALTDQANAAMIQEWEKIKKEYFVHILHYAIEANSCNLLSKVVETLPYNIVASQLPPFFPQIVEKKAFQLMEQCTVYLLKGYPIAAHALTVLTESLLKAVDKQDREMSMLLARQLLDAAISGKIVSFQGDDAKLLRMAMEKMADLKWNDVRDIMVSLHQKILPTPIVEKLPRPERKSDPEIVKMRIATTHPPASSNVDTIIVQPRQDPEILNPPIIAPIHSKENTAHTAVKVPQPLVLKVNESPFIFSPTVLANKSLKEDRKPFPKKKRLPLWTIGAGIAFCGIFAACTLLTVVTGTLPLLYPFTLLASQFWLLPFIAIVQATVFASGGAAIMGVVSYGVEHMAEKELPVIPPEKMALIPPLTHGLILKNRQSHSQRFG